MSTKLIESANLKTGQWKVLNLRNEGERLYESEQNIKGPTRHIKLTSIYIVEASKTGERGAERILKN